MSAELQEEFEEEKTSQRVQGEERESVSVCV